MGQTISQVPAWVSYVAAFGSSSIAILAFIGVMVTVKVNRGNAAADRIHSAEERRKDRESDAFNTDRQLRIDTYARYMNLTSNFSLWATSVRRMIMDGGPRADMEAHSAVLLDLYLEDKRVLLLARLEETYQYLDTYYTRALEPIGKAVSQLLDAQTASQRADAASVLDAAQHDASAHGEQLLKVLRKDLDIR